MSGLVLKQCSVADIEIAPNFNDLLDEYGATSAIDGLPQPRAKIDLYKQIESSGKFVLIAAYLDDVLIGLITVLTPINPHYSACVAVTESFFVCRAHRKSGAGLKLLKEAERIALESGSNGLLISTPIDGNLCEVLPHVGYEETNRVFFRKLANA